MPKQPKHHNHAGVRCGAIAPNSMCRTSGGNRLLGIGFLVTSPKQ